MHENKPFAFNLKTNSTNKKVPHKTNEQNCNMFVHINSQNDNKIINLKAFVKQKRKFNKNMRTKTIKI